MNCRLSAAAVVAAGMLTAGVCLQPLRDAASAPGEQDPGTWAPDITAVAGCDASIALLGGLRALVADGIWLRTYRAWSVRDRRSAEALLRLVTLVDSRPVGYWLNGARMMAYDCSEWRLAEAGVDGASREALAKRIREDQAAKALAYLSDGWRCHPTRAEFPIEMANIHLNVRRDVTTAAALYHSASELPDAPYYAARIYAELLKRLGKSGEAYAWLRRICPTLPRHDESAMREIVVRRISELEDLLDIARDERYRDEVNRCINDSPER